MSKNARTYICGTVVLGALTLTNGVIPWHSDDAARFVCYFIISMLVSGLKVSLPGITGTMSTNFFFVLICVTTLRLPETLTIACASTILQCLWRAKSRPALVKVLFNVASISIAVNAASYWY